MTRLELGGTPGRSLSVLWAAAAILLCAAALRFSQIGAQSLWHDEGNSYVQAMRGLGEIAFHAGRDIHPPGYYWLLAGWRLLAGESEMALRLPSAFASLLTAAFAAALGRRLFGAVAGLSAAVIVGVSTFSIYYAQEARMYALLALWTAAGFWALAEFLRQPSARRALLLAAINTAGLYTQYALPLFMIAQGIVASAALIRRAGSVSADTERQERRAQITSVVWYAAANLLTIALFLPWLPTAWAQIATWPRAADPVPALQAFADLSRTLILGIVPTSNAPAIAVILMLFGAIALPARPAWRWLLPIAWTLLPVVLFIGFGLYQPDDRKLMLPAQIGAALWIGRGVWVLWTGQAVTVRSRLRALTGRSAQGPALGSTGVILGGLRLAAALSLLWMVTALSEGLGALRTEPAFQRADYRGAAAQISTLARPGDAVILDAPNQAEVFGYYFDDSAPVIPLPAGLSADDDATRRAVEQIIGERSRIFAVFWGEDERDPNRIVEKTLDAGAFEMRDTWYGDVRLVQYVTPAELTVALEVDARFGDAIWLEDAALNGWAFVQGDALQVELRWRTDTALDERYKVFVQLLNPDGTLAAQRDSEPGGGLALTTTWTPGEIVSDRHALELPAEPGQYTLIIGLYAIDDASARLVVNGGDSISLGIIDVRHK
ncbi:MAG: glycosyltransferase family 39 protein [Anaerolineae bacterium]|nr:glycosyltransferase family 39 protein [Anaerolineae bacterium]NUQ03795.1 glycosyltransferase family 39 protein [Anaerolineae bacterium]